MRRDVGFRVFLSHLWTRIVFGHRSPLPRTWEIFQISFEQRAPKSIPLRSAKNSIISNSGNSKQKLEKSQNSTFALSSHRACKSPLRTKLRKSYHNSSSLPLHPLSSPRQILSISNTWATLSVMPLARVADLNPAYAGFIFSSFSFSNARCANTCFLTND